MENTNMNDKPMPMHHDQFIALTREGMYEELKRIDPAAAKGKSRATKQDLKDAYRASLVELYSPPGLKSAEQLAEDAAAGHIVEASGDVEAATAEMRKDETRALIRDLAKTSLMGAVEGLLNNIPKVPFNDFPPSTKSYNGEDMVGDDSPLEHVHTAECGHLPEVAGVAEMHRVNPVMPEMPFQEMHDGSVVQLPPDDAEREFVYRDSGRQDRPLTTKQEGLWGQFIKAFKVFQDNPADSGARRTAKAYAYDLKVNGVLVNPKFLETLAKGAAHVREVRRQHKLGIDMSDVKAATKEQSA